MTSKAPSPRLASKRRRLPKTTPEPSGTPEEAPEPPQELQQDEKPATKRRKSRKPAVQPPEQTLPLDPAFLQQQQKRREAFDRFEETFRDKPTVSLDDIVHPPGDDWLEMERQLGGSTQIEHGRKKSDTKIVEYGDVLQELIRRALYSNGSWCMRATIAPGKAVPLRVVSGHRWGGETVTGPVRADCLVLGKMLGEEEVSRRRNLVGPSGQLLYETACQFETEARVNQWYVTNLLKTSHPEGYGKSTLKKGYIDNWLHVLHQELRLVRPKYILCLGADALKALLGDRKATISSMTGRVKEHKIGLGIDPRTGEQEYRTALVMAIAHPAQVLRVPETEDAFKNDVARWVQLTRGQRWDLEEEGLDHRVVETLGQLKALELEIDIQCEDNLLGLDAEWHGQHPQNQGWYLRSFQIAWKHKTAAAIRFRDEKGRRTFQGEELAEAKRIIKRICRNRQLAGHFFDADMEFLTAFGLDFRRWFRVPDSWQQYMRICLRNLPCGFDTGLAAHAINETDDFGLTHQTLRYTTAPRYDTKLIEWKKRYCAEQGMKQEELEGFGPCPDSILFGEPNADGRTYKNSYACYDPDVTRRLAVIRKKQLGKDVFGNNCWEPFWVSMRALPAVLEMNTKGVLIDRKRVDELTELYMRVKEELEWRVRKDANWPTLNLNSVEQVREYLFGEKYNGSKKKCRLRPSKARSLRLRPVMTTDKRPMAWDEVERLDLKAEKTASTNKTALAILAQESQAVEREHQKTKEKINWDASAYVNRIRDYRFISQILKSVLRPPIVDATEDGVEVVRQIEWEGALYNAYAGGLPAAICDDGRVRTHYYATKETGRWASARPPLHNLSKRREPEYKRICGDQYKYSIRSLIMAPPGRLLIEADYVGAELFGAAILSGDPVMVDHALRNQLREDDPNFYDIHSNVAVLAFRLQCPPTKSGLKSIGKAHLRIVAKSTIFGLMYGRGAKAIALQAKEEGVTVSVDEAQQVIDAVFRMYPRLSPFFDECRRRSADPRWLCTSFGRYRRFPVARERSVQGDFERQAMNFPMQCTVADAVDRAVDNFTVYREQLPPDDDFSFDLVFQGHDALMFETDDRHVPRLVDEVIPLCMSRQVPIWPCQLDGVPKDDIEEPYYFGVDTDVCHHWGELMYPDEFLERGLDPKYGGWSQQGHGWAHVNEKAGSVLVDGEWQAPRPAKQPERDIVRRRPKASVP